MPTPRPTVCARRLVLAAPAAWAVPAAGTTSDAVGKLDAANSYTWSVHAEGGGGRNATGKVDRAGSMSIAPTANHKPLASAVHALAQAVRTAAGWRQIDDVDAAPGGVDLVKTVNIDQTPIVMIPDQVEPAPPSPGPPMARSSAT